MRRQQLFRSGAMRQGRHAPYMAKGGIHTTVWLTQSEEKKQLGISPRNGITTANLRGNSECEKRQGLVGSGQRSVAGFYQYDNEPQVL
jgi:hypothetical protein